MNFIYQDRLNQVISRKFPYFREAVTRQYEEFGESWSQFFEENMEKTFGDDFERFDKAVEGYGRFALEGMKLQKMFDKIKQYEPKSYIQVSDEVYQNKTYMLELYLPGIFLAHFLWRHEYKQYLFFHKEFLPLIQKHGGNFFYDVGVGTGFYSKEMLRTNPNMKGSGIDLSPFSMEYALNTIKLFGFQDRYVGKLEDIIQHKVEPRAPFLLNIEVLEHLEDPQTFLFALNDMLEIGGYGLISAALTAPNADHIYLYNTSQEVIDQLTKAGFIIIKYIEDPAYLPRNPGDSVPRNAAFLVTK